jgi:hypothetical protein
MEYVYFFRETGRPYVKIGMSINDLQFRFQQFKTYAPLGAYIVGFIKTKKASTLENELHKKYKDKRLSGEFFSLTDDEVYNEINKHNSSFGEVVSFLNELIQEYDYSLLELKSDLKYKLKKFREDEQKYTPDEVLINYLTTKKGMFLTNNFMIDELNELGYIINQYQLGMTLSKLGYEKKRKKVNGISAIVYIL